MFEPSQLRKIGATLRFFIFELILLLLACCALSCDRNSTSDQTKHTETNEDTAIENDSNERFRLVKATRLDIYSEGNIRSMSGTKLHESRTLYVFWGIWCDVCHEQLDQLEEWVERTDPPALRVVTVQNDGEAERERAIEELDEHGWPFPAILPTDEQLELSNPDNLTPTAVLVSTNGREVQRWIGFGSEQRSALRALFATDTGEE